MTQKEIIEIANALNYDRIMTMARHYEREFRILEKDTNLNSQEFTCDVISKNAFEIYHQPFVYRSIQRYLKNKNLNELNLKLISYNFLKKYAVSYAE
jgi:hypothetical protein